MPGHYATGLVKFVNHFMANSRRNTRTKNVRLKSETPAQSDMAAVWMLGFGLLLFLALVSYTPDDLPARFSFSRLSSSEPSGPSSNFIGPVGAIFAGLTYFSFGAASYLIPAGLLWFTVAAQS